MNERKGSRKQRVLAWAAAMGLVKKDTPAKDESNEAIASLDGLEVTDSSFDDWAAACAGRASSATPYVVHRRSKTEEKTEAI